MRFPSCYIPFIVFLISAFEVQGQRKIEVLQLHDEERRCSETGINIPLRKIEPEIINEMTVCLRFSVKFKRPADFLSIDLLTTLMIDSFEHSFGFISFNKEILLFQFDDNILPDQWNSICYNFVDNACWAVLNGKLLHDDFTGLSDINIPTEKLHEYGLTMGKQIRHVFYNRFHGMISDINFWSVGLPIDEMIKFTTCGGDIFPRPDVLDWSDKGEVNNTECFTTLEITPKEFCTVDESIQITMMEEKELYYEADLNCKALNGDMFIPKSDQEFDRVVDMVYNNSKCNVLVLGGMKTSNNQVIDTNGQLIEYNHWGPTQPNGRNIQNCISLVKFHTNYAYNDMECKVVKDCYVCRLPSRQSYVLRGLDPDSDVDTHYLAKFQPTSIEIRGLEHSIMFWDNDQWCIDEEACVQAGNRQWPPFGLRTWNVSGESRNLFLGQDILDKFPCRTFGNMIPMWQRCNGQIDCVPDAFDEDNCEIMEFGENYRNSFNPTDGKSSTTQVKVQIHIQNIFDIKEIDSEFKIRMKVRMEWFDQRITFRNLEESDFRNIIPLESHDQIWTPLLLFANSVNGQRTILDSRTFFNVKRSGNFEVNPLNEVYKDYIYKGSENPFSMERFYTLTLRCRFELKMYPFDSQSCPISLEVPFDFVPYMDINVTGKPSFASSISFLQYEFLGLTDYNVSSDKKGINLNLNLQRIYTHHLITTFLPTVCLIIIAELCLFIDPSHFDATIMVALTAMLVMYTLYQSIAVTLPSTAYMKMIDIWLFSGLIIPFVVFIALIFVDFFNIKGNMVTGFKDKRIVLNASLISTVFQIFIPGVTAVIIGVYWAIAVGPLGSYGLELLNGLQ